MDIDFFVNGCYNIITASSRRGYYVNGVYMYLSRIFRIHKADLDYAETIHLLRGALPSDELREEERRAYMALSMYKAASRVSITRGASVISPFYAEFLHWRAHKRYIAKFLPLIVNRQTQAS